MDDPNQTPETGIPLTEGQGVRRGKIGIELQHDHTTGQLILLMRHLSGDQFIYPDPITHVPSICIFAPSQIEIELENNMQWEFDRLSPKLLAKSPMHWRYYAITSNPSTGTLKNIVLHATPTGRPKEDPQTHPFNLYVLFDQGNGRKLPVIIDPDIKNPPPFPPLVEAVFGPVPLLSANS